MTSISNTHTRSVRSAPPLFRAIVILAGGLMLFLAFLGVFVIGYELAYMGRIYQGVSVSGIDLSGKSPEQASAILQQRLSYPDTGQIVFQDKQNVWVAKPAEVGLQMDSLNSALAAYSVGRQGDPVLRLVNQYDAWYSGENISPLLVFDERVAQNYLEKVASQINRPTIEAELRLNGAEVINTPGQIGHVLDIPATLVPLKTQLHSMSDGILPLEIDQVSPAIMDTSKQAEVVRQILNEPLNLLIPNPEAGDPGPWTFSPERLSKMLVIERIVDEAGAHFQVGLKADELRPFLEDLAPQLSRYPENARFIFNDDTRQLEVIESATIGRSLDVFATIDNINQKLGTAEHNVPMEIVYTQPQVGNDATADSLGITEPVSVYTSHFRGSSAERIQNIQTAAAEFHGLLVPPGATFSMAESMQDVSLDNGYSEALIIFGGRTVKGVGGGVCQVSTTLFRTVFFGGYPVVERHPHAYRVGYYEQTGNGWDDDLAGLDATVFVPMVDFQFTNDTPNWLLMETYVNPGTGRLTWKFYSTSENRSVEWQTTGTQNIVEPPKPLYEENPELAKGKIKQVDWEAKGADVTVTRFVYRDGEVMFEDVFSTHYEPWQAVYQYGPGTKLPKNR